MSCETRGQFGFTLRNQVTGRSVLPVGSGVRSEPPGGGNRMRARTLVAVLAAVALAAGVTGCAAKTSGSSPGSAPAAAPSEPALSGPAPSGAAAVAVPAGLAFKGTTVDGKAYDAATLAGK